MDQKIFDKYNIRARYFPAILTAMPYTIIRYFLLNQKVIDYFKFTNDIVRIGNISLFFVILYFLGLINRTLGKFLFERVYFKKGCDLPTTKALMPNSSTYSKEYKKKLGEKIKKDFGLILPTAHDMDKDITNTQTRIIEIVDHIRKFVKNGELLLKHNIEYGFWRNLIGGLPIMLVVGIIALYFLWEKQILPGLYIMSGFIVVGIIILISSKRLISQYGEQYRKVLIQEYMGN